jgi:CRP-like cAMP-binding protein
MSHTQRSGVRPGNRLLARLPPKEYDRLRPHLEPARFEHKQVLYELRSRIEHAYFPNRGVLSAVALMQDGSAIEVATVGNEGVVGLLAYLGGETSPNEVMVQVEGDGVRIRIDALKEAASGQGSLADLMLRYHTAYLTQVSQQVACNGLHPIQQRCCRWLLSTQDRVGSNEVTLTHEFLGVMLGVRRASVTEVLRPLQEEGFLSNGRGAITILNRKGLEQACCECYRVVQDEFERLLG